MIDWIFRRAFVLCLPCDCRARGRRLPPQAAELLRRERRENLARISYLTNRVRDLEERQMDSIGAATTVLSEPSEG